MAEKTTSLVFRGHTWRGYFEGEDPDTQAIRVTFHRLAGREGTATVWYESDLASAIPATVVSDRYANYTRTVTLDV